LFGVLTVKPLTPETWGDFADLFGRHNGVRGGCWCVFNLLTSAQFDRMSRDERRECHFQKMQAGQATGLLVYDDNHPVAWCQFGRAGLFPRFERMRAYQALALPPDKKPDWRIACLFVDKHRRKEGLSSYALHAAIESIRAKGGGIVESFPFDIEGIERPSYTGSVAMYEHEGFQPVCRLGKNTVLMRLVI
jgi:GNAT superfamily N-acetyltransferase